MGKRFSEDVIAGWISMAALLCAALNMYVSRKMF